jgi:hypothetical protein
MTGLCNANGLPPARMALHIPLASVNGDRT